VPTRSASIELLASRRDVWAFLSEPYHLADWWPNVASVEPDRRGFATGARWQVRTRKSTWLRRAGAGDTLVVHAAEPGRRFAFELVQANVRAEIVLEPAGSGRSRATLVVSGPLLPGFPRHLPDDALGRLHDLVQTAAEV
jgi:uncharacterized protein YndB with AHSA1/START domain